MDTIEILRALTAFMLFVTAVLILGQLWLISRMVLTHKAVTESLIQLYRFHSAYPKAETGGHAQHDA